MDETEYLLLTEANRKHLEQALLDAEDPTKRIYVDIENLKKLFETRLKSPMATDIID